MKKKGFTLVELLVSVVIIALLTLIVIPGIRKLYIDNQKSLYKSYEKVVLEYGNAENTLGLVDICNIESLKYVKDDCNGYILEEDGKRHAFISCGDYYVTNNYNGEYACNTCGGCETSESLGKIDVTAKAAGNNYIVNRPYGEVKYVNTTDIQVTFRASENVERFAYFNVANNVQLGVCDNIVDSDSIKTCTKAFDTAGMYYVKGYIQGKVTSYKAYFNIKIDLEAPTFNFDNNTTVFDMTGDEWDTYEYYPYTNKIVDLNDNIGVTSLVYRIDTGTEKNILNGNHDINENLFGNHTLYAIASDEAGNVTTKSLSLTFKRDKKDDVLTINKYNGIYDGNAHPITVTAKSGLSVGIAYYSDSTCSTSVSEVRNAGKYYARLTTTGNYAYNPYSSCSEVGEITRKSTTLSLGETSATLVYETNKNVNINNDGDGVLTCSSANTSIATCSISGNILVITPKPCNGDSKSVVITVTSSEGQNYSQASAQFTATVNRKVLTCPSSPSDKPYTGSIIQSGITCPNGSYQDGVTSAKDANTYIHKCIANDGYKFNSTCSVNWKITPIDSGLSISSTSGTLTFGTNGTVTISSNSTGAYSCTTTDSTIATCSISNKTLTIIPQPNSADNKKATIKVTQAATTNYVSKTVEYSVTVNRKSLNCPNSPADKEYTGTTQNSGVTCPTNSTAGGDTSKLDPGTYAHTCTAQAGYKFDPECSVSWKIKDKIKYTISYSCNGGTCNGPTEGIYVHDVQIPNPSKTFKVTISGNKPNATISSSSVEKVQTFKGWTSSTDAGLADTAKTGTGANPTNSWTGSSTKNTYFKNLRKATGTVYLTANWTPVSLTLPTITKTGYNCGYSSSSTGTTIEIQSGVEYTPSSTSGSITLYPVCIGNKYTATFVYNSNTTSGSLTVATKTVECQVNNEDGDCTVSVPSEVTSSKGKYNMAYNGVTTSTNSMGTVETIKLTKDTKYYANYSNAISITCLKSATDTETKTSLLYRNEYFTSDTAMKTITSSSKTGTSQISSITINNVYGTYQGLALLNNTTTCYAVNNDNLINTDVKYFYVVSKYTVTYDKGSNVSAIGGTSASCLVTTKDKKCSDGGVKLPSITANTGYSPVGWSTTNGDSSGAGAGTKYILTNNETKLYANASENVYTIAYNCNGGTCSGPTSSNYGSDVQMPIPTKNFTVTIDANGTGATIGGNGGSATKAQNFSGWTSSSSDGLGSNAKSGVSANPTTGWNGSITQNKIIYFKNLRDTTGNVKLTANWDAVDVTLPPINKVGNTCGYSDSKTGDIKFASGGKYTPSKTTNSATLYAICKGNTITATFIYNSNKTSGSLTVSSTTATCTVASGETSCTITVPSAVTGSVGKYNSAYYGVSDSTGNMTASSSISASSNSTYYAIYSSEISITYLNSATTTNTVKPGLYRNEYFTSTLSMTTIISASKTSTTQATTNPTLSNLYGGFVGLATSNTSTTCYQIDNANLINTNLTTFYACSQYNVSYKKGSHVSSIGNTSGSCIVTSGTKSCNVTLPTITPESSYVAVGWNTSNDALTGTTAGQSYKLTQKSTELFANAKPTSIDFADKTLTTTFSTSQITIDNAIDPPTTGSGNYSYAITEGNSSLYFGINGRKITITAPANESGYVITVKATDTVTGATASATYTIIILKKDFTCSTTIENYTYGGTLGKKNISTNPGGGDVTYYRNTSNSTSGGTAWSGTTSTTLTPGKYYIYATIKESTNYKAATCSTGSFTVSKGTCVAPTNVTIGTDKKVSWTASSTASSYEISMSSGSGFTAHTSGSVYSAITDATGSRTVYVRSVCNSTNYNTPSSNATATTTVYSVTLTKVTGISAVSGAGNYITGATVTLGATVGTGYTWSKWTKTSDETDVSGNQSYSAKITSSWGYKANATVNALTFGNKTITKTFSTSAQTETNGVNAASNGSGNYTYAITGGNSNNYFSLSGRNLTIAASTPANTTGYAVTIKATDTTTGATKAATYTIKINKADFTCTTSKGNYAYNGTIGSPSVSSNPGNGTVTYYRNTSNSTSGGTAWSGTTSTTLSPNTYYIYATIPATTNYNGATCSASAFTVSKGTCAAPTGVTIGTNKKVSWTNATGASSYKVCVASGTNTCTPSTAFTNGSVYSAITNATGSRTVYVKSICDSTYYGENTSYASKTTTVYNVTLTAGTGISAVTGTGNYITGATVTLGATLKTGYEWSKWIQTSGGAQVSTTQAYSAEISGNWNYTAVGNKTLDVQIEVNNNWINIISPKDKNTYNYVFKHTSKDSNGNPTPEATYSSDSPYSVHRENMLSSDATNNRRALFVKVVVTKKNDNSIVGAKCVDFTLGDSWKSNYYICSPYSSAVPTETTAKFQHFSYYLSECWAASQNGGKCGGNTCSQYCCFEHDRTVSHVITDCDP